MNSGVRNECDPAHALLSDYVLHDNPLMRVGSILGLGLAYAGSNREDIITKLLEVFADPKSNMEVRQLLKKSLVKLGYNGYFFP